MSGRKIIAAICFVVLVVGLLLVQAPFAFAEPSGQVPTGSIPTVTSTPLGAYIIVKQNEQGQVNLRAGPHGQDYGSVGILVVGQQVPALGQSVAGDWIQIAYPGGPSGVAWVYAPLVDVTGSLPIVEPPSTATPLVTPTIDPTLAAQFLVQVPPTRLPTYTPPPPLSLPTFTTGGSQNGPDRVPMGFVIIGLAVIGLFGTLISFIRGR